MLLGSSPVGVISDFAAASSKFLDIQATVDSLWNAYVTWQEHTVKVWNKLKVNNENIGVVLVYLLLILKIFQTLF